MAGVNRVTIIGNLGKDSASRSLNGGGKVVNFSVAVSESWKDKNSGERKEKTEWINIVIFNENIAKVAEQYLKKGSKVYLEGKLRTRKWQDQSGADKYTTEVVLENFSGQLVMLDGKNSDGGSRDERGGNGNREMLDRGQRSDRRPIDDDSDIPF